MEFYISDKAPIDPDEIRNKFIEYFENINQGDFARYETGYDKDISSTKTFYYGMYLARGKTPILSNDFLSFLRNKRNLYVLTTSHSDFYVTFGYHYKINYTVSYQTTESEISGFKVSDAPFYSFHKYDVDPVYSSSNVLKSFNETRSHSAVGIVKIDYSGNFYGLSKTDECDSLSYWPVNPNRQAYFKGSYKKTSVEEIKKLTYLKQFSVPSNSDISDYIKGYCGYLSDHYSVIREDKAKIKDEYYSYNIYEISDDSISISNSNLISTFYLVCVNSYTYKIKFTYKQKTYEYDFDTLPPPDKIFLEYSPEFSKYHNEAFSILWDQKFKTENNEEENLQKTNSLQKLFHRRKTGHLVTMLLITAFFLTFFTLSMVYQDYLINYAGLVPYLRSMLTWPICLYQIVPLLLFGISYFLYSHSQTVFKDYRFSRNKNYLGQVEVIEEAQIKKLKRKDSIYSAILIVLEVFLAIGMIFHLLLWIIIFMGF